MRLTRAGLSWTFPVSAYRPAYGTPGQGFYRLRLALHQKSGQKSDSAVNRDFLASFEGLFEAKKLHFSCKKRR